MNRKLNRIISRIFSAPIFPIVIVFLFVYFSGGKLSQPGALRNLLIGWTFLSWIPVSIIIYARKVEWSEEFSVPKRDNRTEVFILAILSYILSTLIFWHFSSHLMFMISLAYVVVTSCMAIVNLFWKISIHAAGIAGPTTALVYVFGMEFSILYLLLIPVSISRYKLGAHSKLQLLGGILSSAIITFLVYFGFY